MDHNIMSLNETIRNNDLVRSATMFARKVEELADDFRPIFSLPASCKVFSQLANLQPAENHENCPRTNVTNILQVDLACILRKM